MDARLGLAHATLALYGLRSTPWSYAVGSAGPLDDRRPQTSRVETLLYIPLSLLFSTVHLLLCSLVAFSSFLLALFVLVSGPVPVAFIGPPPPPPYYLG